MKIAVLVGSLRKDSWNKKLALAYESRLPEGVTFEYADLQMPLYNNDLESDFPVEARALKDLVESSDGVLIVTPEYNRATTGVLKNALDWASRPWKQNSFAGKPTALAGITESTVGTAVAQAELRNIMVYLETKLMSQPEAYMRVQTTFADDGSVRESAEAYLQAFIDALVTHVSQG